MWSESLYIFFYIIYIYIYGKKDYAKQYANCSQIVRMKL